MTVIDPCVLTAPCWLEEHLWRLGVADTDWSREIPAPVIAVVQAMHARGASLDDIAAHFAAAAVVHAEVAERNAGLDGDPFPPYPLGGTWVPKAEAVAQVLDAPGRRSRRHVTRPSLIARQRVPQDQAELFDLAAGA